MTQVIEHQQNYQKGDQVVASNCQNALTVGFEIEPAACTGLTSLFFSERTVDMRAAQTICSTCPKRIQCLEAARAMPPFAGVWGGVIFVNGEETLLKRGRGRPRKSEQLDNARVLKALEVPDVNVSDIEETKSDEQDSNRDLVRQIA